MQKISKAEAIRIANGGLAEAELKFVASLTAPLYWIIKEGKQFRARNGSVFFMDAGNGLFAVTAQHVIAGLRQDALLSRVVACQIGHDFPLELSGKNQIIDEHEEIDIATFNISERDVAAIGKTVLRGCQMGWPPWTPQVETGITYCGYAGSETWCLSPTEYSFGTVIAGGIASSVSERDVSTLIDRESEIPIMDLSSPPDNFDFGGISGGPMLMMVERNGLRLWALAGVIYQGPNPSSDKNQSIHGVQIIRARRAHFILPDGKLDRQRWGSIW